MQVLTTGIRSRTHLVHLAAWLRSQQSVTLTVGDDLARTAVSEDDIRALLPDHVELRFEPRAAAWPTGDLTYLSVGAPGIKPWIALHRKEIRRRVRVVVTDEGLGTYGDWRTRRAALAREGAGEPQRTVRAAAVASASRLLTGERFALYVKEQQWAVREEIAREFHRHTADVDRTPSGDLVLLTQPWVRLGVITEPDYRAHIDAVAAHARREGMRLVVRPHPTEDTTMYAGLPLVTSPLPAELDPRVVTAAQVAGSTSTALLNLAAIFDRPATRLVIPGLEHLEDALGRDQRALLARHLPQATRVRQDGRLESVS
ncbi:hypothetical protein G9U51_02190 [Calidifontibacter sp. DB0510]|uniref:Uncharacterized protein n=1 Tax=Metallococcus carri TaxID=1656884 RepID=A0A967E980_9MICO|nr:hypothetical protein [Metallococcus carri]NHN54589.1 hypothetical protein [Metallococcus carri]NOP36572.1 hypothetical protein [Calidifontibacter sp. DB2511S]